MPCGITVSPTVIPAITSDTANEPLYFGSHSVMGSFRFSCFLVNALLGIFLKNEATFLEVPLWFVGRISSNLGPSLLVVPFGNVL